MNWLKRKLNKLFSNDDIDENYEYDNDEVEERPETPYIVEEQQRPKFRFPLIKDDELGIRNHELINQQNKRYNGMKHASHDDTELQVYDVEVSRIHELLEMRRQKKKVTRNNDLVLKRHSELLVERENKKEPIQTVQKIKEVKQETINPLANQKRFIPTDVPSPVHGFQKPKPINSIFSNNLEEHADSKTEKIEESLESTKISQEINELQEPTKGLEDSREQLSILQEKTSKSGSQEIINASQEVASTTIIEEIDKKLELVKEDVEQIISKPIEKLSISIEQIDETPVNNDDISEAKDELTSNSFGENQGFEKKEDEIVIESTAEERHSTINVEDVQFESNDLEEEHSTDEELQFDEDPFNEEMEANSLQVEKEDEESRIEENILEDEHVEELRIEENILEDEHVEELRSEENILVDEHVEEFQSEENILVNRHVEEFRSVENFIVDEHVNGISSVDEQAEEMPREENTALDDRVEVLPSGNIIVDEQENVSLKKEKPIPFNVIMLKSDKEKLEKKVQVQEITKQLQSEGHRSEVKTHEQELEQPKISPLEDTKQIESTQEITKELQSEVHPSEIKTHEQQMQQPKIDPIEDAMQVEPTEEIEEKRVYYKYVKPPLECLTPPEESTEDREWMESQADVLVEALSHFQVTANVESIMQGPAVTQFEITVGHGTKVSKIRNLADDLKLALAAKDIRIQAPIPGKNTIGIEIPNRISRAVRLSEVVNSESFLESESPLEAALGLDLTGKPVTIDLRKMPHGLIAGATGSGKSVCINSILVSLLLKAEPTELKLMLIDPKMVELAPFNHIPHLVSPVITDVKAANAALKWAVDEMERRYQLFAQTGVRDLSRYNKLAEKEGKHSLKLPYLLIVIDELADLMMMAPQDVEESICRIAQKARACGIHLIIATQRPSVDVITGLIKSNIPTRIAFAVSSQIDSRTILDSQGAERLLGRGDMLYLGNGMTDPIRLQGTFVTDEEIDEIIEHVKEQGEPDYFFEQEELLKKAEMVEEQDELFEEVCRFVYEQGSASTSSIQRKYHIGYNRAARLIEMLESYGFVSEQKGSKPRDVYITESDLAEMFDRY